ncbi:uncharacterized protein [Physcomitrium patens]|uniref:Uncharacterized protein n=1 Tax=Physcomitrium patens TaxID=3218 RepID=A0A2K1JXH2_PHYPA|nr:uncharacterized protein LOC112287278 [Physcomitrium patens]PNR46228.1 hypothetical protein PHYPA_013347 [Physcomitrium patens]|eukprot:XP_024385913.1 uncharacterized protein LOC112287278 [Physcomitrella patens]
MGDSSARATAQQPAGAVPSAPLKPPLWYRYRAGVGALLLVNLGIGGYVLSRPRPVLDAQLHNTAAEPEKEKAVPEQVPVAVVASAVAADEAPQWAPPSKVPISEDEQRQMLQWVLEEKRKVKTKNKAEKTRINEDKKLLKQYLRSSQLPPLV